MESDKTEKLKKGVSFATTENFKGDAPDFTKNKKKNFRKLLSYT